MCRFNEQLLMEFCFEWIFWKIYKKDITMENRKYCLAFGCLLTWTRGPHGGDPGPNPGEDFFVIYLADICGTFWFNLRGLVVTIFC